MQGSTLDLDDTGRTAVHAVCSPFPGVVGIRRATKEIVKKLLGLGVPVNAHENSRGWTILHALASTPASSISVEDELFLVVRDFLQNGADPTSPDNEGLLPLHVASSAGPHAAPVVHALLTFKGRDSALTANIPTFSPEQASVLSLSLREGGLFSGLDNPKVASSHLFPAAVACLWGVSRRELRPQVSLSACPSAASAEVMCAREMDALVVSLSAVNGQLHRVREEEWWCLDRVGLTSALLPAVFAAYSKDLYQQRSDAGSPTAAPGVPAWSLSLRDNGLTDLPGPALHLATPRLWSSGLGAAASHFMLAASSTQSQVLASLLKLDLSDNLNLARLPEDLAAVCPMLSAVYLSGCGFDHFPPSLADMPNLQLVDLRANKLLDTPGAHASWLDRAINRHAGASNGPSSVSSTSSTFEPPPRLLTIAAAPLQKLNATSCRATKLLALELARRVVVDRTDVNAASVDLGHRGLTPDMLQTLSPEIATRVKELDSLLWAPQYIPSRRVQSFHHKHDLNPGTAFKPGSIPAYRQSSNCLCDLCSELMLGATDGYSCTECKFDVCDDCGSFLLETKRFDANAVRFISTGSSTPFHFFVHGNELDGSKELVLEQGYASIASATALSFETIDGEMVSLTPLAAGLELCVDSQVLLVRVWSVTLPLESEESSVITISGFRDAQLKDVSHIELYPSGSYAQSRALVLRATHLLRSHTLESLAAAAPPRNAARPLSAAAVQTLIWCPQEHLVKVELKSASTGATTTLPLGVSEVLSKGGAVEKLHRLAREVDGVNFHVSSGSSVEPESEEHVRTCGMCSVLMSSADPGVFTCNWPKRDKQGPTKHRRCEVCDFDLCEECWPLGYCDNKTLEALAVIVKEMRATALGRTQLDVAHDLLDEGKRLAEIGSNNWAYAVNRAVSYLGAANEGAGAIVAGSIPPQFMHPKVLLLQGNHDVTGAATVPAEVLKALQRLGGAAAIQFGTVSPPCSGGISPHPAARPGADLSAAAVALRAVLEVIHPPEALAAAPAAPAAGAPGAGHTGAWRGGDRPLCCSTAAFRDGPLCAHGGGVVTAPHWSCCGARRATGPCLDDAPAAAAAVVCPLSGADGVCVVVRPARPVAAAAAASNQSAVRAVTKASLVAVCQKWTTAGYHGKEREFNAAVDAGLASASRSFVAARRQAAPMADDLVRHLNDSLGPLSFEAVKVTATDWDATMGPMPASSPAAPAAPALGSVAPVFGSGVSSSSRSGGAPCCPQGHPLVPYTIGLYCFGGQYTCDVCGKAVPQGAVAQNCRACNYGMCAACAACVAARPVLGAGAGAVAEVAERFEMRPEVVPAGGLLVFRSLPAAASFFEPASSSSVSSVALIPSASRPAAAAARGASGPMDDDDGGGGGSVAPSSAAVVGTLEWGAGRFVDVVAAARAPGPCGDLFFKLASCEGGAGGRLERSSRFAPHDPSTEGWVRAALGTCAALVRASSGAEAGPSGGCGPDCTRSHSGEGNCLVCHRGWGNHSGHTCTSMGGQRGSWPLAPGTGRSGASSSSSSSSSSSGGGIQADPYTNGEGAPVKADAPGGAFFCGRARAAPRSAPGTAAVAVAAATAAAAGTCGPGQPCASCAVFKPPRNRAGLATVPGKRAPRSGSPSGGSRGGGGHPFGAPVAHFGAPPVPASGGGGGGKLREVHCGRLLLSTAFADGTFAGGGGGGGEELGVGDEVVLSDDYASHADAGGGPLAPGDVGVTIAVSSSQFHVRHTPSGRTWW